MLDTEENRDIVFPPKTQSSRVEQNVYKAQRYQHNEGITKLGNIA